MISFHWLEKKKIIREITQKSELKGAKTNSSRWNAGKLRTFDCICLPWSYSSNHRTLSDFQETSTIFWLGLYWNYLQNLQGILFSRFFLFNNMIWLLVPWICLFPFLKIGHFKSIHDWEGFSFSYDLSSCSNKGDVFLAVVFHFLGSVLQMKSNVMFIICL